MQELRVTIFKRLYITIRKIQKFSVAFVLQKNEIYSINQNFN